MDAAERAAKVARMPKRFREYWEAHPELPLGHGNGRRRKHFPRNGSPQEQATWFRDQFLALAEKERDPNKKAGLLAKAMSATVQTAKAPTEKPTDPQQEYRDHLERMVANREAERDAESERQN